MRAQSTYAVEDSSHICCPMQATEFSPGSGACLKLPSEESISGTCRCNGIALSFLGMPSLAIEAEE